MGFKARHQDWKEVQLLGELRQPGQWLNRCNSYNAHRTAASRRHHTCGASSTVPTLSSSQDTLTALRRSRTEQGPPGAESTSVYSQSPRFSTAPLLGVWGQHWYYCSTCLMLLRGLETLKRDDEIWILLGKNWDDTHGSRLCFPAGFESNAKSGKQKGQHIKRPGSF